VNKTEGFVSGHDFSRAANGAKLTRALQAAQKLTHGTKPKALYQGTTFVAPQTAQNERGL